MATRHAILTTITGMHPPLGFSTSGDGSADNGRAPLGGGRTDACVWVDAGQANRDVLRVDTTNEIIYLGNATDAWELQILGLGGARSSHWRMVEATAPATVANTGAIYTVDASGVTELRYVDSAGVVREITPLIGGVISQASGSLDVSNALANGQRLHIRSLTESHTLAAAATSDTAIQIPADALVLYVSVRVTTLITGCTTFDYGVAGATTRYGTGLALTAGTTNDGRDTGGNPRFYSAATAIRFSAIGGGGAFTAGVVRTTIHYMEATPPTS